MFGKKLSIKDIAKAYNDLSQEDKSSFKQTIVERPAESGDEQQTIEESKSGIAEENSGETVAVEEETKIAEGATGLTGEGSPEETVTENTQDSPPVQVASSEQNADNGIAAQVEQKHKEEELYQGFNARIETLEAQISKQSEIISALTEQLEKREFGLSPAPSLGKGEDLSDDKIMQSYYRKNPRAYRD